MVFENELLYSMSVIERKHYFPLSNDRIPCIVSYDKKLCSYVSFQYVYINLMV